MAPLYIIRFCGVLCLVSCAENRVLSRCILPILYQEVVYGQIPKLDPNGLHMDFEGRLVYVRNKYR